MDFRLKQIIKQAFFCDDFGKKHLTHDIDECGKENNGRFFISISLIRIMIQN